MKYLVADAILAAKDLLNGLPVLHYLGVDTKTLLEEHHDALDETDFLTVKMTNHGGNTGCVNRLIVSRLNRVSNDAVVANDEAEPTTTSSPDTTPDTQPKPSRGEFVDYVQVREEQDPFPDASILDLLDEDRKVDVKYGIQKLIANVASNGLPEDEIDEL